MIKQERYRELDFRNAGLLKTGFYSVKLGDHVKSRLSQSG